MSKEIAQRLNTGKPSLSYVLQFPTSLEALARVKEMGAIKYERDNWRKGGKPWHEYIDSCMRHLLAYVQWQTDESSANYYAWDTGCSHLAHAVWNLMALQDLNHPGETHDQVVFDEMAQCWEDTKTLSKDEVARRLKEIQEARQ